MARKVQVMLVDDIDGKELDAANGETVTFALDGVNYEIDLSKTNSDKMRKALGKYMEAARKIGRASAVASNRRTGNARARNTSGIDPKVVREWASQNGIEVNDRGRIPGNVVEQFQAAQSA